MTKTNTADLSVSTFEDEEQTGTSQSASSRGAEVVGMLGDSVVSVKHVESPARTSSKHSRTTYLLLAAGVIFLLVAGFAFAKGVSTAAANQRGFQNWTQVEGHAAHEFRPERLSPVYDFMVLGGLASGLAALALGFLRLRVRPCPSSYTVGRGPDADFAIELAPAQPYSLVEHRGDDIVVTVAPGLGGELHRNGLTHSLDVLAATGACTPSATVPGGYQLRVPEEGSVRVIAGPSSIVVRSVPVTTTRLQSLFGRFDRGAAEFFCGSALAHLALVALLAAIPATPQTLSLNQGSTDAVAVNIDGKPFEKEIPDPGEASGSSDDGDGGSDSRIPGERGLAGTTDSDSDSGKTSIKNRSEEKTLARADAMERARNAGIAGAMKATSHMFKSMHAYGDFSSGYGEYDEWGTGGEEGTSKGLFGHSTTGIDYGDGSNPDRLYKVGPYRTGPDGDKPGKTGPDGNWKEHKAKGPDVEIPLPKDVDGALDREIVRRHVKRKLPQIRYAYEKQLLVSPELEGTLTVVFLIDGRGQVIHVNATGIDSKPLQTAVERIIKSIQFPRPADGSSVSITYPFHLHLAGR